MLKALLPARLAGSTSAVLHCISGLPVLCQTALHIQHTHLVNQYRLLHLLYTGSSGCCSTLQAWRGPPLLHTTQQRDFSAASEQQQLTIKTALRQLYKRVHPDLFVDYPAEQVQIFKSCRTMQDLCVLVQRSWTTITPRDC